MLLQVPPGQHTHPSLHPLQWPPAIGSGSRFAIAAARALIDEPGLSALDVAQRAMRIAADKCIYVSCERCSALRACLLPRLHRG